MSTIAIADITRAYAGSESALIDAFESAHRDAVQTTVVALPRQQAFLNARQRDHVVVLMERDDVTPTYVQERIWSVVSDALAHDGRPTVCLYTFHGQVFSLRSFVDLEQRDRLVVRPWKDIRYPAPPMDSAAGRVATPWPDSLMSQTEAVSILRDALASAGAVDRDTAIWKTSLRAHLEARDRRFSKRNPTAAVPGLVSMLLDAAVRAGAVRLEYRDPANPTVYLSVRPPASTTASTAGAQESGSSTGGRIADRRGRTDSASRSQQFISHLRSQKLGPFSDIRAELWRGMAEQVRNRPGITLLELVGATIREAKLRWAESGRELDKMPWRAVRSFVFRVLQAAPILLNETGEPIRPSFESLKCPVFGMEERSRERLEGVLVVALAEEFDIWLHDLNDLTGALHFSRDEGTEGEVLDTLSYLLEVGVLVGPGDGIGPVTVAAAPDKVATPDDGDLVEAPTADSLGPRPDAAL